MPLVTLIGAAVCFWMAPQAPDGARYVMTIAWACWLVIASGVFYAARRH